MTDEAVITRIAIKHSVYADAKARVLRAGPAAADWRGSPDMMMVGDMFTRTLKRSATPRA
jgi:hypothetical protein